MFDDLELINFVRSYCHRCEFACDTPMNMRCAYLGTATALKVADEMNKCQVCLEMC